MTVVDVGASGGIDARWRVYGDQLRVLAFEPDPREYERLVAQGHPTVRWFPLALHRDRRRVTFHFGTHVGGSLHRFGRWWERLSASQVDPSRVPDLERIAGQYGSKEPATVELETRDLDSFLDEQGAKGVDFIKTDTDGSDHDVLLGARRTLEERGVLGVKVEVYFAPFFTEALFADIDRLLAAAGLVLVDLATNRYSRKELPARFAHRFPAQTVTGPLLFGDALYMRDPVGDRIRGSSRAAEAWSPMRILKLASLYEVHGLPDCAAELVAAFRAELEAVVDPERLLDALTPPVDTRPATHAEYVARFHAEPGLFFPSAPEASREELQAEIASLEARIRFFERSLSWKVTAPFRILARLARRLLGGGRR